MLLHCMILLEVTVTFNLSNIFQGANRDLSFKVGDKIKVTDSSNPSGWWKGELMTGQTGFFPYTFVTPIPK